MKTRQNLINSLFLVFPVIFLAVLSTAFGQTEGVALEFPSTDPIVEVVATEICFELVARDSKGNILQDWNSSGEDVTLQLNNSIAVLDTIVASCNWHPDGYTWVKLFVNGVEIDPDSDNTYTISPGHFTGGKANCCFQDSKIETGVTLEITPTVNGLVQTSPSMTFTEGELFDYMVELIGALRTDQDTVFLKRLYQILVTPRDRYCNDYVSPVPTRFTFRFPGEFALIGDDIFTQEIAITGETGFQIASRIVREEGVDGQWIRAMHFPNLMINGMTDDYFILPHAPYPFALLGMPDSTEVNLMAAHDSLLIFTWERPDPPDPYTDCTQSIFDPVLYSDEVRYKVKFYDEPRPEFPIRIEADGNGLDNSLSLTVDRMVEILNLIYRNGISDYQRLLWHVEASDGLFMTTSDTNLVAELPGYRLFFLQTSTSTEGICTPASFSLEQNYPNPFNPSTNIGFVLPWEMHVTLVITDPLGRELRRLIEGESYVAGHHTVTFESGELPSGVYVYHLAAGGQVMTRRMLLLR